MWPFTDLYRLLRGIAIALSLAGPIACAPHLGVPPSAEPVSLTHADPARDAHVSLLREAHKAFVQERYANAVVFFRRFVEVAPDSPRLPEARWWLGRSYEQVGEFRAALDEYRRLAIGNGHEEAPPQGYRLHALQRLDELRNVPAMAPVALPRQIALEVSLDQVPPVASWVGWLQSLLQAGVTVLVLEPASTDGLRDETTDNLRAIIGAAHVSGMAVWVVLDPHRGVGEVVQQDWKSLGGTVSLGRIFPDVTHPGYQEVVEAQAWRLARTGCDGLLLRAREGDGFAREYSDGAWQRYASAFGVELAPAQLLSDDAARAGDRDAQYWRWVGWKARAYVSLASRVRVKLREMNPTGRLMVEIHGATVRAPLVGLEHYGEDLAELLQRTGGGVVVRRERAEPAVMPEIRKAYAGSVDRWWLEVDVPTESVSSVSEWVGTALATVPDQGPWNLLIRRPSAARIP